MAMELRELNARDTFTIIRLAKKLGITDSIVSLFKQQDKAKDLMKEQKVLTAKILSWQLVLDENPGSPKAKQAQQDMEKAGERLNQLTETLNDESFSLIANLVEIVIENIDGFEEDVFSFLGDLTGMTKEEFAQVSLIDFSVTLRDFFEKPELRAVAKLFTPSKASAGSTDSGTNSTNATIAPMT